MVSPQGISSTANLIRFHLCCSVNTGTKFGSHPTPCLLYVNNFYKGSEKRKKKVWHKTKAAQTEKRGDDRRNEDRMKFTVIGRTARQRCWNESALSGSEAMLNSERTEHEINLNRTIKGSLISVFLTISSIFDLLLLIIFLSSCSENCSAQAIKGHASPKHS